MRILVFSRVILAALMVVIYNTSATEAKPETLKLFFFLDTECPVSNAYMKEIKNIYSDYSSKGISVEAIFPVPTVTDPEIKAFLKKYNAAFPGHKDAGLQKVKRYHATVMPEAILVNSSGVIVYQGAIDNWYYALGKSRIKATEHYLRNAINATLNDELVQVRRTNAIGCLINL